jgi:hypothetical protein
MAVRFATEPTEDSVIKALRVIVCVIAVLCGVFTGGRPAMAVWNDWCSALFGPPLPSEVCCDRPICDDTYCRPAIPSVIANTSCCCDTYCRPLIPCVSPVSTTCCDDYCRKPIPSVTCPACTELHRCSPPLERLSTGLPSTAIHSSKPASGN